MTVQLNSKVIITSVTPENNMESFINLFLYRTFYLNPTYVLAWFNQTLVHFICTESLASLH